MRSLFAVFGFPSTSHGLNIYSDLENEESMWKEGQKTEENYGEKKNSSNIDRMNSLIGIKATAH